MKEKLYLKKAFPNITQEVVGMERRKGNKAQIPDPIGHFLSRLDTVAKKNKLGLLASVVNNQNKYILSTEDVSQGYIDNQRRIARELGHGDVNIPDEQMREQISMKQRESLNAWLRYFASPDALYPMWFKYFVTRNVVKLDARGEKRGVKSANEFPALDQEAVTVMLDMLNPKDDRPDSETISEEEREIIKNVSFSKMYSLARKRAQERRVSAMAERAESVGHGAWIKYSSPEDAQRLSQSVAGTGWCTAGVETARIQLGGGDFYVYYTQNKNGVPTVPRVAIRMENGEVAEVRGVNKDQEMEADFIDTAREKFLQLPGGDRYEKKSDDMKRLTRIEKAVNEREDLPLDDLRFLYEVDQDIEGFGYERDPRIDEVQEKLDIVPNLQKIIDATPDDERNILFLHNPFLFFPYFGEFTGINHKDVLAGVFHSDKLAELDQVSNYWRNHWANFHEYFDAELAERIIESKEAFGSFSQYIGWFHDLNYDKISETMIENGGASHIMQHIEHFPNIDHNYLVRKVIEENAYNNIPIEKLHSLNEDTLLLLLDVAKDNTHRLESIAYRLKFFGTLSDRTVLKFIEVGRPGSALSSYCKDLSEETAFKLIELGRGTEVVRNLGAFQPLNNQKLAEKFVQAGKGRDLIICMRELPKQLDYEPIAHQFVETGQGSLLYEYRSYFTGISPETLKLARIQYDSERQSR